MNEENVDLSKILYDIIYLFNQANAVCTPDVYQSRHNRLIMSLAGYIIARDFLKPENEEAKQ